MKAFFPDGKHHKSMSYLVGLLCLLLYLPTRVYSQQDEAAYFKELYKPVHHTISETNAFILERIEMEGADTRFPFLHFRQKAANEIRYVILLHEIDGSKNNWNESEARIPMHSTLRDSLLNLGFNLLIPDLKFHGERASELPGRTPSSLHPANVESLDDASMFYRLLADSKVDINYMMNYISSSHGPARFDLIGVGIGGSIAIQVAYTDNRVSRVVAINTDLREPYASAEDKDWPDDDKSFFMEVTPGYALEEISQQVLLLYDHAKQLKTDSISSDQSFKLSENNRLNYDKNLTEKEIVHILGWLQNKSKKE